MARTIKVVRGGSDNISTGRLEIAQAQLLRARVCGNEAQVGFNFLQRLLNEVIRRRQEETTLFTEVDDILVEYLDSPTGETTNSDLILVSEVPSAPSSDELVIPDEVWNGSFDFSGLEITDLEQLGKSSRFPSSPRKKKDADLMRKAAEEVVVMAPVRKRSAVLANSRQRYRWAGVNSWRILVITLLVAFAMTCGVFLVG